MLLVEAARFLFNINDAPVAGDTRSENKELFFQLEMGDSKIILFPRDEVSICLCIYFGIFKLYMSCSERELKSLFTFKRSMVRFAFYTCYSTQRACFSAFF